MRDEKAPKMNRLRSKDYRDIFVWGVYGGERIDYFEVVIQSFGVDAAKSQETEDPVVEVRDEVCLKMTPRIAKIVYGWLGSHIKSFEKSYGQIEMAEKNKE